MMTNSAPFNILMAEDDEDDRILTQDAITTSGTNLLCHAVHDGQELLNYLRGEGTYTENGPASLPSVILLDLNMPILDGRETLKHLKQDPLFSKIPVVILSTSDNDDDINDGYQLGASSYLVKPNDFSTMVNMMKSFNEYWSECACIPRFNASTI